MAAMGAAFFLASLTPSVAAAATGSATAGESGAAQRHALAFGMHVPGMHVPSAAERRALPAALRDVAVAVSGPWHLYNRNSGDVMEVYHSYTSNGAKVDQWTNNGTNTQKWMLVDVSSITNQWSFINVNSSKCLDDTGTIANYVQMYQWTCQDGNFNQIFSLFGTDHDYFTIRPYNSRGTYCVEVKNSLFSDGAPVDEYQCNNTWTQQWIRYTA